MHLTKNKSKTKKKCLKNKITTERPKVQKKKNSTITPAEQNIQELVPIGFVNSQIGIYYLIIWHSDKNSIFVILYEAVDNDGKKLSFFIHIKKTHKTIYVV